MNNNTLSKTKTQIRQGCFETNSSSSHSIVFSDDFEDINFISEMKELYDTDEENFDETCSHLKDTFESMMTTTRINHGIMELKKDKISLWDCLVVKGCAKRIKQVNVQELLQRVEVKIVSDDIKIIRYEDDTFVLHADYSVLDLESSLAETVIWLQSIRSEIYTIEKEMKKLNDKLNILKNNI